MTAEQIFNAANIFVLPLWALMILLPNLGITRKVMNSFIPFVVLAVLYIYLFISSITPENAAALSNPKLADIARFFGDEKATATGWIHFLVMDLFVGRWIYWEGQRTGVWTIHSLALSLFAGPMGLLSHIVTYWVTQKFFPSSEDGETVSKTTPFEQS
ncbi:ABA4-like family protein [Kamptonema sp. UHCC 0994]|uniref:ABA4-like family protein n=1 Tax=Kamptonema sp. UHCC 0994 TaxID=3031329 RepID=UPI0023B968AF|nr:ABA4-like family protein [Kamptonema sp. UHCC 0994]MDF0552560.1 ABA4-like family protein [Kamptonema sp. UHCC 0994]